MNRISYLGKCYFHQDYDDVHGDAEKVLRGFVREEPRENIDELKGQIDGVLRQCPNEARLRTIWLRDANAYFEPDVDGQMTYRQWFERMLELLSE